MADEDTSQLLAAASAHVDNSTPSGMAASWEHVESGVDHGNDRPGQGDSETKTGPAIPADLLAQVRAEAARGAREEMTRLLGDNAKYVFDQRARTQLVKQAYFAITAEAQLSAFVRHLFTTAWVEILLMLLALLFYFGDSKASTSHFVFIFTLHILRPPALLWVLNRVPRLSAVVFAVGSSDESMELEKHTALTQLRRLKMPIAGLAVLTCLCGVLDVLAILLRLWDFKDLPQNEIAPSVLLFLLALAFTSVDFSAVFWYFSLKYNLPSETVDRLTSTAVAQTHQLSREVATAFDFTGPPAGSRPLASQA